MAHGGIEQVGARFGFVGPVKSRPQGAAKLHQHVVIFPIRTNRTVIHNVAFH